MERLFDHIAALSLTARLIYSLLGVVLIRSGFRLLERTLPPHFGYGDQRYHVRKTVTATSYIIIFTFITILFADRLKHVGFAVGVIGAGVVVALQDVVSHPGGIISIGFSQLYPVGDRNQVNWNQGDRGDISLMRKNGLSNGTL